MGAERNSEEGWEGAREDRIESTGSVAVGRPDRIKPFTIRSALLVQVKYVYSKRSLPPSGRAGGSASDGKDEARSCCLEGRRPSVSSAYLVAPSCSALAYEGFLRLTKTFSLHISCSVHTM